MGSTSAEGRSAWRTIMELQSVLLPRYERELEAAFGLSLTWYDVLHHLAESPDGSLRMSELASALTFSKSGLTTLADRIERAGLVAREADPGDRRATLIRLTPAGRSLVDQAIRAHKAAVQRHFTSRMSEAEERMVAEVLGRVLDQLSADSHQ